MSINYNVGQLQNLEKKVLFALKRAHLVLIIQITEMNILQNDKPNK